MPFTKHGSGRRAYFTSPSGNRFTPAQVRAYYATKGFTRAPAKKKPAPATRRSR